MRYILDAYNIIGKYPNISLSDPQKEEKFITLLNYHSHNKHRFLVIFDGHNPTFPLGTKTSQLACAIIFTKENQSADDYIISHVTRLKQKTGVIVVTSDQEIIRAVKRNRLKHITSEQFISQIFITNTPSTEKKPQATAKDVDYWLTQFGASPQTHSTTTDAKRSTKSQKDNDIDYWLSLFEKDSPSALNED